MSLMIESTPLNSLFSNEPLRRPLADPPGALGEDLQPNQQRLFGLLGETLLFETNHPALLEAAQAAFGRFPRPSPAAPGPLALRLLAMPAGLPASPAPWPTPQYRTQAHLFTVTVGQLATAVADLERGFSLGFVDPALLVDLGFVRYVLVEALAFAMLATARHSIPLHAAGVVRQGGALLLCGSSCSGKSSLALACLRRGYRLVSENTLFLKGPAEQMTCWGAPWIVRLRPESQAFFPGLPIAPRLLMVNGSARLEYELSGMFTLEPQGVSPAALVFLSRQPGYRSTRLLPLAAKEARERLEIVWPFASGWTPDMDARLERLLGGPRYLLEIASPPETIVDLLDALADSLEP
jgi:hypothetical protein